MAQHIVKLFEVDPTVLVGISEEDEASKVSFGHLNLQGSEGTFELELGEDAIPILVELLEKLLDVYTSCRDFLYELSFKPFQFCLPLLLLFLSHLFEEGVPWELENDMLPHEETSYMLTNGLSSRFASFGRLKRRICEVQRALSLDIRDIWVCSVIIYQGLHHLHLNCPDGEVERCLLQERGLLISGEPASVYALLQLADIPISGVVPHGQEILPVLVGLIVLLRPLPFVILHRPELPAVPIDLRDDILYQVTLLVYHSIMQDVPLCHRVHSKYELTRGHLIDDEVEEEAQDLQVIQAGGLDQRVFSLGLAGDAEDLGEQALVLCSSTEQLL